MEDRPFFNPYLAGGMNVPPNIQGAPNAFGNPFITPELSPKEIYENQYFYYRCMNEYIDYMMKSKEFESKKNQEQKRN